MEQEPPQAPPEDEDAKILPFKRPETPIEGSIRRHPAMGRETPQETLARLGLDIDPDDLDDA